MIIDRDILTSIILNREIDHRLPYRPVSRIAVVANVGYFPPVISLPNRRQYALAPVATGQPMAVRSCGYSEINPGGARSS